MKIGRTSLKRFALLGLAAVAAASLTVAVPSVSLAGKSDKVSICKVPAGNPANVHPISVSPNAVAAQLADGNSFYDLSGTWHSPWYDGLDVSWQSMCTTPASIDYPALAPCSGTWTTLSASGDTYLVREDIPYVPGSPCVTGCTYELTYIRPDAIDGIGVGDLQGGACAGTFRLSRTS